MNESIEDLFCTKAALHMHKYKISILFYHMIIICMKKDEEKFAWGLLTRIAKENI